MKKKRETSNAGIDTDWFYDAIARSQYGSLRAVAKRMKSSQGRPLEPSALSRILRGKQAMRDQDRAQLAEILNVDQFEILRRSGVIMNDPGMKDVILAGHLDKRLELHLSQGKNGDSILGPSNLPAAAIAVRCQTARSEHDAVDGWVLYAEKPEPYRADMLGRLCLVGPKSLNPTVAFISRGYKAGTVNLESGLFGTFTSHENITLEWASPILWIQPQA
jgi:hypothetical protein